jgi:hypothetical protein
MGRLARRRHQHAGILSPVRLLSSDNVSIELSIARYQFPDLQGHGDRDWDANWLQISGAVVLADGKTWSFEDPSLTTWEAAKLGQWLREVADGSLKPLPFGTGEADELLWFTEPNLAFGLEERIADQVLLRVHFSLEALPPWLSGAEQPDIFDFFVVLDVPAAQVDIAAADWAVALGRFPQR